MSIVLTSTAFSTGQPIPAKFTGDGKDASPALAWSDPLAGTKEFALICDDPDAPTPQPWVHWLLYNIPGDFRSLAEGLPASGALQQPPGAKQGCNSWGQTHLGYRGPAPPRGHGVHHYHFRLYALDALPNLKPGIDKLALVQAMQGHILDQGELIGTYQR